MLFDPFCNRGIDYLRPGVTDFAHAEVKVIMNFIPGQWFEFEMVGNTFTQLTDRLLGQVLIELGLPEQNDLQQLVFIGFKIR